MEDWEVRGLDPFIAARLVQLGIKNDAALREWLIDHPSGTEAMGRIMVTELRAFLTEQGAI